MAAGSNGKQSGSGGRAGTPAVDAETKRKFREALDKKRSHGGRDISAGGDDGKVHDAQAPAKGPQMFRRKAGS